MHGVKHFVYAGRLPDAAEVYCPRAFLHACFGGVAVGVDADGGTVGGVGEVEQACVHADDGLGVGEQVGGLQQGERGADLGEGELGGDGLGAGAFAVVAPRQQHGQVVGFVQLGEQGVPVFACPEFAVAAGGV